jgi:hypothetical protein
MNIFVYDEHTPAQAKKQAGRESFLRISSGQTLPLLGDHELALDVDLQPQKKTDSSPQVCGNIQSQRH